MNETRHNQGTLMIINQCDIIGPPFSGVIAHTLDSALVYAKIHQALPVSGLSVNICLRFVYRVCCGNKCPNTTTYQFSQKKETHKLTIYSFGQCQHTKPMIISNKNDRAKMRGSMMSD